eukprot:1155547-Pelagomonas_calceolata.AAC.6
MFLILIEPATKLALELHSHAVQYAHEMASTTCTLEKTFFTSRHQNSARDTASKPPVPIDLFPLGEGDARFLGPARGMFREKKREMLVLWCTATSRSGWSSQLTEIW